MITMENLQKLKQEIRKENSFQLTKQQLKYKTEYDPNYQPQPCGCLFAKHGLIGGLCTKHFKRLKELEQ